ncbi:hypothetical protein BLOT_000509 [Blomia tropicalis]|nr:hypothetical protein BLOT_000509 [Blomia tropicalis]
MDTITDSSDNEDESFNFDSFSSGDDHLPMFDQLEQGPYLFEEQLHTVCAFAIKCQHNSMPLSCLHLSSKSAGLWLPYVSVKQCYRYDKVVALMTEFFLKELSIPYDRTKLLDGEGILLFEKIALHSNYRVQIPNGEFIDRLVYLARWKQSDKNCCRNTAHVQWLPINIAAESATSMKAYILQNPIPSNHIPYMDTITRFWGWEICEFAELNRLDKVKQLLNVFEYTSEHVLKYVRPSSCNEMSPHERSVVQFISDSHYTEVDVLKMYCDFVQHCFPSINMCYCSFKDYCSKISIGIEERNVRDTFRAMIYKSNKWYLTFNEFLTGMISLDPTTSNTLFRYPYIFRYYDHDSDGMLDRQDVIRMLTDCGQTVDATNFNPKFSNFNEFIEEIESKRLKDIGTLFRVKKSIIRLMHESNAYEMIYNKYNKPFGISANGTCNKCRSKNISLASHSVKLLSTGRLDDPKPVPSLERLPNLDWFESKHPNVIRKHSLEYVFKSTCTANNMLQLIRKLAGINRMTEEKRREVKLIVQNGITIPNIRSLCDEMVQMMSVESRVMAINTPTLVVGDIHGNIHDLLNFEEKLWPMAPVACYLFAMKILAPNKFFLVRGNHEVRQVQRTFTFEKECKDKFGSNGLTVFEMFNRVFDTLPFAAVIDEQIFCSHGGIPCLINKIEELNRLPANVPNPDKDALPIWEILWSDPISTLEYQKLCEFQRNKEDTGFLVNTKRATGYYFNENATSNFLTKNNLTHVIRAHELIQSGYKFDHHGMVITVFSSSHYCGGNNEAAVILVDVTNGDGLIKVLSFEN